MVYTFNLSYTIVCLISDGETLIMVFRHFRFIDHCHGAILRRNTAVAVLVYDKIVFAQPELAGSFARFLRTGTSHAQQTPYAGLPQSMLRFSWLQLSVINIAN